MLFAQGHVDEAAEHFRGLLQRQPGHPRAHLGLARLACAREQFQEALTHLHYAASTPYTQKAAYALLAEIHQRLGDQAAATQDYRLLASLPDDRDWPNPFVEEVEQLRTGKQGGIERVNDLLAQNQVPAAITLLQEQVRRAPEAEWAWFRLGLLLIEREDFAEGERALRAADRLRPESAGTQFYLGVALFRRQEVREAARYFRRAIALKPDYGMAYYNLGHCLKQQGDPSGALEAFHMAVRCLPGVGDAHTNLGDLLAQQERYAEALAHLRNAARLNPKDARVQTLLGQVRKQVAVSAGPY